MQNMIIKIELSVVNSTNGKFKDDLTKTTI